jgi:hypothetical protein
MSFLRQTIVKNVSESGSVGGSAGRKLTGGFGGSGSDGEEGVLSGESDASFEVSELSLRRLFAGRTSIVGRTSSYESELEKVTVKRDDLAAGMRELKCCE